MTKLVHNSGLSKTGQGLDLGGILWEKVYNFGKQQLSRFVSRHGYVPRSSVAQKAAQQQRISSYARAFIEDRATKEYTEAAKTLLSQISPDLVSDDKWIGKVGAFLLYLDRNIFPGLGDVLLYPSGSISSLVSSVQSVYSRYPSGDPEEDAKEAVKTAQAYFNYFYSKPPTERQRLTWGLPAGSVGQVVERLANAGILNPRTQTLDHQIQILSHFLPAVGAVIYFRQQTGKPVGIPDAVDIVFNYYTRLPQQDRSPRDLAKNIISAGLLYKRYTTLVTTPRPAGLPSDKAAETHAQLLIQAEASVLRKLLGVIGYAVDKGLVKPGSPADLAWKDIMSHRLPEFLKKGYGTYDEVAALLRKSGVRESVANYLVSQPEIGLSYGGDQATFVVRLFQGEYVRRGMRTIDKRIFETTKGSYQERAAVAEAAKSRFLSSLGYKSIEMFNQLHPSDTQELYAEEQEAEAMLDYPPDISTSWQKLFEGLRTSRDFPELVGKFLDMVKPPTTQDESKPQTDVRSVKEVDNQPKPSLPGLL